MFLLQMQLVCHVPCDKTFLTTFSNLGPATMSIMKIQDNQTIIEPIWLPESGKRCPGASGAQQNCKQTPIILNDAHVTHYVCCCGTNDIFLNQDTGSSLYTEFSYQLLPVNKNKINNPNLKAIFVNIVRNHVL